MEAVLLVSCSHDVKKKKKKEKEKKKKKKKKKEGIHNKSTGLGITRTTAQLHMQPCCNIQFRCTCSSAAHVLTVFEMVLFTLN